MATHPSDLAVLETRNSSRNPLKLLKDLPKKNELVSAIRGNPPISSVPNNWSFTYPLREFPS